MGSGGSKVLSSRFRVGKQDYYLGGHPLWEVFRCIYQMKHVPYFIGGIVHFSGYFWAGVIGHERPISEELVRFRRKEQMQRLKCLFRRIVQLKHRVSLFT